MIFVGGDRGKPKRDCGGHHEEVGRLPGVWVVSAARLDRGVPAPSEKEMTSSAALPYRGMTTRCFLFATSSLIARYFALNEETLRSIVLP